MKKAIQIALLQFRLVLKGKGALFTMFGMPLLFTVIFGLAANPGADSAGGVKASPVAVVDQDGGFLSRTLVDALDQEDLIAVRRVSRAEMDLLFANKQLAAGIVIPAGFEAGVAGGAAPAVELISPPDGSQQLRVSPAVTRTVNRVVGDYRLALAGADRSDEPAVARAYQQVVADRQALGLTVSHTPVQKASAAAGRRLSNLDNTALGFIVMFVMATVFGMTGVILDERRTGTWGRLLASPTGRLPLLAGYLLSFLITGLFQFAVLVAASSLLFRVQWGPLPQLSVLAAAFVLCSAGLGLFIAGLVRTPEQQRHVVQLVVVATSMLGGAFWPLEFVGETMQRIGYLTPQAWALEGFREVMLRGGAWEGLAWPLTVLVALAAIFLTAGLVRVRYES